jgi:hypothetical protein
MLLLYPGELYRLLGASRAHEGAHKTFGFSTLKIWLKGVIIAFLVTIT